jgi:hypothetical protein
MLTKTEIRLLDRYFSIYARDFDKATFYQAVANTFPSWRGEQLFESDAYETYLETFAQNTEA